MTNFLQLCKDVARESGTFPNWRTMETITNVTKRDARLVSWVSDAYVDIQNSRDDWRWLRSDFTATTITNTRTYTAQSLAIADRFSSWIHRGQSDFTSFSINAVGDHASNERFLQLEGWEYFRKTFQFGSFLEETGFPSHISENDQQELVLYPTPVIPYQIRGRYLRTAQVLQEDFDIPEMPERFHKTIRWGALMLLGTYDEATVQMPLWGHEYRKAIRDLINRQTPSIRMSEPLA